MKNEDYKVLFEKANKMIENGEVQSIKFDYDEENGILNIFVVPVKVVEHVNINITVTPTGVEFTDP